MLEQICLSFVIKCSQGRLLKSLLPCYFQAVLPLSASFLKKGLRHLHYVVLAGKSARGRKAKGASRLPGEALGEQAEGDLVLLEFFEGVVSFVGSVRRKPEGWPASLLVT